MGLTKYGIPTKKILRMQKTVYPCFSGGVLSVFSIAEKDSDTPVDQQLCVITGDDSHTVQLDRVKVCIRITPNKTLN